MWTLGGVLVDEALALRPELQTVREIDDERNEEVRRLRIERFAGAQQPRTAGWSRYLAAVGAQHLDRRRNDVEGTRELLFRTVRGERLLICHCPSTARMYALEVPREVDSCRAAQHWLWSGSALADESKRPFNIIGRT